MNDHALLELAADLALQAGAIILAVRERGFETLRKDDHSPVTEADHQAERLIAAGLRAATPAIPVIARGGTGGRPRAPTRRPITGWWTRWTARASSPPGIRSSP